MSQEDGIIDWNKKQSISNKPFIPNTDEKLPPIRQSVVDSREPEYIRMKLLERGWTQAQLYSGDYYFQTGDFKQVTITRKTVDDLIGSIGDRFSKQLEEILDRDGLKIILLEGSWRAVNPSMNIVTGHGVNYQTWCSVWNYLQRWQDKGFTINITVDMDHTVQRLGELFALYQKSYSMSAKSNEWEDDRILAFPSGCRGKTAMNTLEEFGSLRNVANASRQEVLNRMQGKKVGLKKANLIFEHFHRGEEVGTDTGEMINEQQEEAQ